MVLVPPLTQAWFLMLSIAILRPCHCDTLWRCLTRCKANWVFFEGLAIELVYGLFDGKFLASHCLSGIPNDISAHGHEM
jgi:hypothetical protein